MSGTRLAADDLLAIQELVHLYADAVVHRDATQWSECWAEDARWDLGRGRDVEGREAIRELWLGAMAGFAAVVQVVNNGTAWPTGDADHAAGRWYITEAFARANGERGTLHAHYDDTYVRRDGAWRFASRSLQPHYMGTPDLSGAFLSTVDALRQRGGTPDV